MVRVYNAGKQEPVARGFACPQTASKVMSAANITSVANNVATVLPQGAGYGVGARICLCS